MALYATNRFPGDGSTTSYEFNFVGKYIARSHVKVYQEDNATKVRTYVSINDGNFLNDTTLRNLPVTPSGYTLVICRDTPKPPLVDFVNGSRFTEYNMDLVARQGLFVAMEAMDAGGIDARQQLLDAVTAVAGLVAGAQAAESDATAAAAAAATSALNASSRATQAQTARTGAEAANFAAQTAKTDAQTAATNAASSATAAGTSASNAAASATTANTRANAANTSATNAAASASNAATSASTASTSATNAATSAANAASSAGAASSSAAAAQAVAVGTSPMNCRVVVVNAASRIVRLERCGGRLITLGGVVRTLPAGINLTLTSTSTPRHLYAGWDGFGVTFTESTSAPVFDATLAQWVNPNDSGAAAVAYVRPDGLSTPVRFLRNYYNGPGMSHFTGSMGADYTADWDGVARQLMTLPILLLPGDTINVQGLANIMSTPPTRIGDLTLVSSGYTLGRARFKHAGDAYVWHNYYCMANTLQRAASDAPIQSVFELYYTPISTDGNTWTVLGDGVSTKLIVNITPYKWA